MEIVGEASNGKAAVELFRAQRPDVVVMDFSMPVMDGVAATRAILAEDPSARVLMLTITADEAPVLDAMLAGACGYQLKDAAAADLVRAAFAAAVGESLISPRIAAHLVKRLREIPPVVPPAGVSDEMADLTTR